MSLQRILKESSKNLQRESKRAEDANLRERGSGESRKNPAMNDGRMPSKPINPV